MPFINNLVSLTEPRCIYCGERFINKSLLTDAYYSAINYHCILCDENIKFFEIETFSFAPIQIARKGFSCKEFDIFALKDCDDYQIWLFKEKTLIFTVPKFEISPNKEELYSKLKSILLFL